MLRQYKKGLLSASFCLALLVGSPLTASAHQQTKHHHVKHHHTAHHTMKHQHVKRHHTMPHKQATGFDKVSDLVLVRPLTLVATGLGTVAYVVSYPITASNGTSAQAKRDLIDRPAHDTFNRPLGKGVNW